jgi:D-alanine-D-alanine ligase
MFAHIDEARFVGKSVGVVYGGTSAERSISLKTGRALAQALRTSGLDVHEYDLPEDLPRFLTNPPAAVLLGMHGGQGEDGTIQGFLETLQIPYTGSGVRASALAMDKAAAKAVMREAGVQLARGVLLDRAALEGHFAQVLSEAGLSLPLVLKPNDSGSSCGVYVCRTEAELEEARAVSLASVLRGESGRILCESMIEGAEFSVGFFGDQCLGAIEITPAEKFYDFHAKYEAKTTNYTFVEDPVVGRVLERVARGAWRALGCRGVGRVDVMGRVVDGALVGGVLEVNTIPGMTATSIIPKLAARHGISFERLALLMLSAAQLEHGQQPL